MRNCLCLFSVPMLKDEGQTVSERLNGSTRYIFFPDIPSIKISGFVNSGIPSVETARHINLLGAFQARVARFVCHEDRFRRRL